MLAHLWGAYAIPLDPVSYLDFHTPVPLIPPVLQIGKNQKAVSRMLLNFEFDACRKA